MIGSDHKPGVHLGVHMPSAVKVLLVVSKHAVQTVALEHVPHPGGQGTQIFPCLTNPLLQVRQLDALLQVAQLGWHAVHVPFKALLKSPSLHVLGAHKCGLETSLLTS